MFATLALAAAAAIAVLAISMSDSGRAAFPGANGRVAYSYGDGYSGSIWAVNADGSAPTRLTNGSSDYGPHYSANGGRIAFERDNGVAAMNADGSAQTQLLAGSYSSSNQAPEWQSNYPNPQNPSEIIPFVKIQTFTETWHIFDSPSYSPDGSQLVVREGNGKFTYTMTCEVEADEDEECVSGYEGGHFFYDDECIDCFTHIITVSSASGAQIAEVAPASKAYEDYEPTFSPSGQVAFTRWSGSPTTGAIYVVTSPGAAPLKVTNGPYDSGADFSPDGSRIAFTRSQGEIGIVGAGGGPLTVLSVPNPPGVKHSYVQSVAFSPDGSRLVIGRRLIPTAGQAEVGIYTLGLDGSGLTKIASGSEPSWQPNALPAPPPPVPFKAKASKGKVKLDKKGRGTVGTITCGSTPCTLKVLSAMLKAGQDRCPAKAKLPKRLGPGKSAKLRVSVKGKCLAALKKAGKGSLLVRVRVSDALGKKVVQMKATLTAGKAKKKSKK